MESNYEIGALVTVDDDVRKFNGVITGKNPKNTAEYLVKSDGWVSGNKDAVWCVHWCYIRRNP